MRGRSRADLVLLSLPSAFLATLLLATVCRAIPMVVTAGYIGSSMLTAAAYAFDKSRAERGGWRVAENRLHLLEALGGWPGALVAQRLFRHKNRKVRFQFIFWIIVLTHLAVWTWLTTLRF